MSWYEQATDKLQTGLKSVSGNKENVMKRPVLDALLDFCRQNEEFAQAVVQGGSFRDCMAAVSKGVGGSISDLEAYRRAASFYFDGAKVQFSMTIQLEPADVSDDAHGIVIDLSDFF